MDDAAANPADDIGATPPLLQRVGRFVVVVLIMMFFAWVIDLVIHGLANAAAPLGVLEQQALSAVTSVKPSTAVSLYVAAIDFPTVGVAGYVPSTAEATLGLRLGHWAALPLGPGVPWILRALYLLAPIVALVDVVWHLLAAAAGPVAKAMIVAQLLMGAALVNPIARQANRWPWVRASNPIIKLAALCVGVVVLASASAYVIEWTMIAANAALGSLDRASGASLGLGCTCGVFCVSFFGKALETAVHHPVERGVGYLWMAVAGIRR